MDVSCWPIRRSRLCNITSEIEDKRGHRISVEIDRYSRKVIVLVVIGLIARGVSSQSWLLLGVRTTNAPANAVTNEILDVPLCFGVGTTIIQYWPAPAGP